MASKKKTGVGTLPHEIMMEQWRKEGRVKRQELSLKAIKLDHRLQAREKHLDVGHVKELHGYVKDGAVFPPIVVFRVEGKDFVGNGFHRCEVHRKEGRPSITADVVDGTWQEAVEFATCCNFANAALTPNIEDKKKAAFMLFDNGWRNRSYSDIAEHVGSGCNVVKKWLTEYCQEKRISVPDRVFVAPGVERARRTGGLPIYERKRKNGSSMFSTKIKGQSISLGHSFSEAKAKTELLWKSKQETREVFSKPEETAKYLAARGIHFVTSQGGELYHVKGGRTGTVALTWISESFISSGVAVSAIVNAIGRAVVLGESYGFARRAVIVLEPIRGYEDLIDIARRLGIEFMTLDQFVEAVKADEGEASPLPDDFEPNEETLQAIRDVNAGVGVTRYKNADEMFADVLG